MCREGSRSGDGKCRSTDAHAQRKLRVLEQLERETKEFLRPAVEETGRSAEEDPKQIAAGEKLGTKLADMP